MKNRPTGLSYKTSKTSSKNVLTEVKKLIMASETGRVLINFTEFSKQFEMSDRNMRRKIAEMKSVFEFDKSNDGMYVSFAVPNGVFLEYRERQIYNILRLSQAENYPRGIAELYDYCAASWKYDNTQKEIKKVLTAMAVKGILEFVRIEGSTRGFFIEKNFKNPLKYNGENFHAVKLILDDCTGQNLSVKNDEKSGQILSDDQDGETGQNLNDDYSTL